VNVSTTAPLALDPAVSGLAASLAVGLIVGLERGWQGREQADGGRVAGLRTYALIGMLGGGSGVLGARFGAAPLAAGLLGLALIGAVSYREGVRSSGSLSATSAIAALLTYVLGALAASGEPMPAVAAAVVAAVLLDMKSALHRGLLLIEQRELNAGLQMLVLSAVVLPLLPDRGFGPWDALNPYRLWWAVVLVAALSLLGHVAMRISGAQRGMLWTGVLGGLASSTAATLALSRRVRDEPRLRDAAAAGILAACGMMFLRMTVIAGLLQPALLRWLAAPLLASGAALLGFGMLQWKRRRRESDGADAALQLAAPFDLSTALGFGLFLAVAAVLMQAAHAWWGTSGLYGLAALAGLADVDAILISAARMNAAASISLTAAALVAVIAAASNMLVKASMAWLTGGAQLGRRVALGYAGALAIGAAAGAFALL